jgi:hypothetical protein
MTCAVAGCGREIVRGEFLPWVHLTNPGRDHHYARPASRSAADSDLAGLGAASRDEDQPPTEAPGGASLVGGRARIEVPPSVRARFLAQVDQSAGPDGCWPWTGRRDRYGYGKFIYRNRDLIASRFAWAIAHGPIPAGMHVLHHCDNPPCCNPGPGHQFLGTHAENMADRVAKGRVPRGSASSGAVINEATALLIRDRYGAGPRGRIAAIARELGVGRGLIADVVHGRTWTHVPRSNTPSVLERSPSPVPSSRVGRDTLRGQREATDPTGLSDGQPGVPLSLGF